MSNTISGVKNPHKTGSIDPQTTTEGPWDVDWRNEKRRRDEGTAEISEWLLQKRKSRHLAHERNISRQRAAHLLKHEGVEVADSEVL